MKKITKMIDILRFFKKGKNVTPPQKKDFTFNRKGNKNDQTFQKWFEKFRDEDFD